MDTEEISELESSSESSESVLDTVKHLEDGICILPVYKDAIQISTKTEMSLAESTTLYNTLIELEQNVFGVFNQIESVSMNFTEKLRICSL